MLKIFIDSDSDFTIEQAKEWDATMISMPYNLKGKEVLPYVDFEKFEAHPYYETLRKGVIPTTSALNPEDYKKYFEPEFAKGNDIFYIHFSAAMSASFNSMRLALEELKEKYPERKFYEIDTKGITIISYIIGKDAVELLRSGKSPEEVVKWAETEVDHYACYFFADDLKFFAKSGRVSGLAAFMGGIIGIRPILTMGADGKMASIGKVKGRKNAVMKLADYVQELGVDFDKHNIVLGHADAPYLIEELKEELIKRLGDKLTFEVLDVNPTAGAHCGPDTLGVAFKSKHR
ncbi:MAG: DegV family protein [Bacilli bacterium]|nr:DegV family protein [Bacilli bacterium]